MNITYVSGKLNSKWISGLKEIISWILNKNMYCILSIYHKEDFWIKEEKNAQEKYSNFWKELSNELRTYNEYLVLETMIGCNYEYFSLINIHQEFINVIRNSSGNNEERLLIISGFYTDAELNLYNELVYDMPIDPFNKTAISIHYFFPSSLYEYNYEENYWYSLFGSLYSSTPIINWGLDQHYKSIVEQFDLLEQFFIHTGIPVIIGEAGIINNYNNNTNSYKEFLYTIFSLSSEYNGIMTCLWDNYENIKKHFYYDKKNDKWLDESIQDLILKISKKNFVKSSDYKIWTNIEKFYSIYDDCFFVGVRNIQILKLEINAKLLGYSNENLKEGYGALYSDGFNFITTIKKEDGKRNYDGTIIFTYDISDIGIREYIYAFGNNIIFNNITIEYKEKFINFDYITYKKNVLLKIS